jgi:DNA-directed RNA polymerase specialized sigma24 family protein
MNSPDVAAALYAGAPDAAGKLYDAHAEALFQYCWLTLRDRQQAKTAVSDALVQAGARVAELGDPATLRAWLFALVRAECHHHPLPSLGDTDEPIARPEQPDAALRIMAWNSVMSLDLVQRQALDLATRHGMTEAEIGLILSLPLPGTTELLATARYDLEGALGAEILVSRDSLECPGRTEAIHGWTGTVTPEFRERLLEHAGSCAVCRPRLPRNVSAGRIFSLLPAPALDGDTRGWVIGRVGELIRSQLAEADLAGPGPVAPVPLSADPLPADPVVPDPLTARVDPAPAGLAPAEPAQAGAAQAGPAQPEPVVPDPVVTDPVVPDPAAPDPVVPGPAASPDVASKHQAPAEPAEPATPAAPTPTRAPVEVATPEMALLPSAPPEETHEPVARPPKPKPAARSPKPPPAARAPKPAAGAPRPAQRRRRLAPRIFAGVSAAVVAAGIAAGLALGGVGGHARLSGSDSQLVNGPAAPSPAGVGQPDPRPDAPPARPGHRRRSPGAGSTASPAAGGADAVTSGKQAGAQGRTRAGGQSGQTTHRTVTMDLVPSTPAGQPGPPASTRATARLTVSPASLVLGQGSSGTFTLTASGGSVPWSASASSGSVALSPSSGQLSNGGSATVSVTVQRASNSGGSATVSVNGAQVTVSWSATPASSAPSGASGSTGASGASGSGTGRSSPPARRHHRPSSGGSPAPAGS